MKPTKKLKLIFFTLFTLFTGSMAFSQAVGQPEPTRDLEMQVGREVARWEDELSLRAKQAALMERKYIEFALKREEVLKTDIPQETKIKQLVALKLQETRDMRDILTGPQYERYLELLEAEADE
ncbi:hypothetical protein SAMN04488034_1109 [Salinimicrobium catena]|uniref:Periplasmic heavy metal sensor n=1 Tax=Salinimicrobium catena TaxID=390640 RepID=A0A1H5PA58_9FLAO|nr:hypothetical protein [Salinimicrobium catena]SDL75463.1 hypothetical protein SAMN04488140_11063 [Salinimicrobium catena]SEF09941.1 hypothetical protein SAMN04488034_1109 [Salinimicrobium catena]